MPTLLVKLPTAVQEVAETHETALKNDATAPAGTGTFCSVHVVPARDSAKGAELPELEANEPTAMQAVLSPQLIAVIEPLGTGGFAVGMIAHPGLAPASMAVVENKIAAARSTATMDGRKGMLGIAEC